MHLVLAATDSREALRRELAEASSAQWCELYPGLFAQDVATPRGMSFPYLAFARQIVPHAREVTAESVRSWGRLLVDAVAGVLPDQQPWSLHVYPFAEQLGSTRMGARAWHTRSRAGEPLHAPVSRANSGIHHSRSDLVREAAVELLHKRRRHLVRYLSQHEGPFTEDEALVQLVLRSSEHGFLSVAPAPLPFRQRSVLSRFPGGEVPPATDKQAPSRAFAKLVEAEARMARRIAARDSCVDLGASPGSWTYVAARRGARVIAVDRTELRADLMQHRTVRFQRGDAFRFEPTEPVDWLLCDVIAAAERSAGLLLRWLRSGWCQHFIVTLKVDDEGSGAVLAQLKRELPPLTRELWLLRLSANKKEVCAFGSAA